MCKWGTYIDLDVTNKHSFTGEWYKTKKPVDACIAPIVKGLNDNGITTASCCCGHGECPGSILLHDGREITIHDSWMSIGEPTFTEMDYESLNDDDEDEEIPFPHA